MISFCFIYEQTTYVIWSKFHDGKTKNLGSLILEELSWSGCFLTITTVWAGLGWMRGLDEVVRGPQWSRMNYLLFHGYYQHTTVNGSFLLQATKVICSLVIFITVSGTASCFLIRFIFWNEYCSKVLLKESLSELSLNPKSNGYTIKDKDLGICWYIFPKCVTE